MKGALEPRLERVARQDEGRVSVYRVDIDGDASVAERLSEETRRLHWSFPDPSKATGTEEEQLQVYRRVRDAIRQRITAELLTP